MEVLASRLACAIETTLHVARIKCELTVEQAKKLRSFLSPEVDKGDEEIGWHERTAAVV